MPSALKHLSDYLAKKLADKISLQYSPQGELTLEIQPRNWVDVCNFLRQDEQTGFSQLIDLCGIDYLVYGDSEWNVESASSSGFSRAVAAPLEKISVDPFAVFAEEQADLPSAAQGQRFAVVVHLLSIEKNLRIRLRVFCEDNDFPVLPSLVSVWNSANWYEREAFDLFGIMFNYHPDLRRILTDYGFVGHPFRKDFPLIGHVEMRYDPLQQRVIYEPVSIEPRVLVPRVIRQERE